MQSCAIRCFGLLCFMGAFHWWYMGIPMKPPIGFRGNPYLQTFIDRDLYQNLTPPRGRHNEEKCFHFFLFFPTLHAFCILQHLYNAGKMLEDSFSIGRVPFQYKNDSLQNAHTFTIWHKGACVGACQPKVRQCRERGKQRYILVDMVLFCSLPFTQRSAATLVALLHCVHF